MSTMSGNMKKLARGARSVNWCEEETAVLIDLWEQNIEHLNDVYYGGSARKKYYEVYEKITNEFREAGYIRTRLEVQKKISNLVQGYRKELVKQEQGHGKSKWRYFDIVGGLDKKMPPKKWTSRGPKNKIVVSDNESSSEDIEFLASYQGKVQRQLPTSSSSKPLTQDHDDDDDEDDEEELPLKKLIHTKSTYFKHREAFDDIKTSILKEELKAIMEENVQILNEQAALQWRSKCVQDSLMLLMDKIMDNC